MTIHERVRSLLQRHPGRRWCDGCLQSELGIAYKQQANNAVRYLAETFRVARTGLCRESGLCDICKSQRMVTYALEKT